MMQTSTIPEIVMRRAGQGRAGQGRAGQGRAGQGRADTDRPAKGSQVNVAPEDQHG